LESICNTTTATPSKTPNGVVGYRSFVETVMPTRQQPYA